MGQMTIKQEYHCYNDCEQGGCPKHKMEVGYNSVSDDIEVHFNNRDYYFNPTTLELFLKLLKSFKRVEIDEIYELTKKD